MKFVPIVAGIALSALSASFAEAQTSYPQRQVDIVLPFAAGGGTDILTRALANRLGKIWDQSVVVQNKPGANGNLGTDVVAKAKPNGETLLMTTNATIVINPQLFEKQVNYDPQKDLVPITEVAAVPFVVLVNPALGAKTFADFLKLAKEKPGSLSCASSGVGGGAHLTIEMLRTRAGVDILHVPYKGGNEGFVALLGNHVSCLIVSILTATPYIEQNQLLGLAVTSPARNPSQPNIPTVAEHAGLAGFDSDLWYGLLAPKGTDPAIVQKIYQTTRDVLNEPEFKKTFEPTGAVLIGNTPEQFTKVIDEDIRKWKDVIEKSGVRKAL